MLVHWFGRERASWTVEALNLISFILCTVVQRLVSETIANRIDQRPCLDNGTVTDQEGWLAMTRHEPSWGVKESVDFLSR